MPSSASPAAPPLQLATIAPRHLYGAHLECTLFMPFRPIHDARCEDPGHRNITLIWQLNIRNGNDDRLSRPTDCGRGGGGGGDDHPYTDTTDTGSLYPASVGSCSEWRSWIWREDNRGGLVSAIPGPLLASSVYHPFRNYFCFPLYFHVSMVLGQITPRLPFAFSFAHSALSSPSTYGRWIRHNLM